MTSNSDKLRSLILAALMVFSVFAGTVALTGSAAAANNPSVDSFSSASVTEGETQTHDIEFSVANAQPDGDTDQFEVTLPRGTFTGTVGSVTVTDDNGNDIQVDGTSLTDSDQTFQVSISPSASDVGSSPHDYTLDIDGAEVSHGTVSGSTVTEDVTVSFFDSGDNGGSGNTVSDTASLTITDSGSSASASEGRLIVSGQTFFSGEDVFAEGLDPNTDYQVRVANTDGDTDQVGSLRRTITANGSGVIQFELDGRLAEGEFVVTDAEGTSSGEVLNLGSDGNFGSAAPTDSDSTVSSAEFEVVTQDLTAEFDDASVGNDGSGDTPLVDYDISSDVRSSYNVNISAQGDLDVEDLNNIFGDDVTGTEYPDDDIVVVPGDTEYTLDFTDINADTYTFEANVTDADASDADDIEVAETGDESASFGDNVYTDQRGDIVNITINLENTDTGTVQVGDLDSDGYEIAAEIEDEDEDGVAYVEFNSFTAGDADETTLSAGDDDTDVSVVGTNGFGQSPPPANDNGDDILEAGDYSLYVTADTPETTLDSGDADSQGTLSLTTASVENLQMWTVPDNTLSDLTSADAEDISAYAQAGNLTQTDTFAEGDGVVIQVEASGLEGAFDGSDNSQAYRELTETNFDDSESENNGDIVSLTFETSTSLNNAGSADIEIGDLSNDDFAVLYDGENDAHYVVLNSETLTGAVDSSAGSHSDGDEYVANFTVYDENTDLVDDDAIVTQEFTVENPEIELDTNADDEIVLETAAGQEVTGDTNLAPGSTIEATLDSDTTGDPFVKRPEATVQADGTWTAVADFSDNNAGSNFTADAIAPDFSVADPLSEDSDEYDGRLVEATVTPGTETPDDSTGTETADDTTPEDTETADDSTPMDTEEPATTAGGEATETATGGSGPGFTAALALIALVAAALLAVRRNN